MSADVAAHYAAVIGLLTGSATFPSSETFPAELIYPVSGAVIQVYTGVVPDAPVYPYVVIWGGTGTEDSEALSDDPTTFTLPVYATYAGLSFDSVAITIRGVRSVLNRARPVVAGRVTSRMVQSARQPIQADLAISIPGVGHPFYAVDQYDLISDPA